MKRPCEMSPEEYREHKNKLVREWRSRNPEKVRVLSLKFASYRKQWREENSQKVTAAIETWRKKNRSKINKQQKLWAGRNKDKIREYTYKWRSKNRERFKANQKAWQQENREKTTEYRRAHRHSRPEQNRATRRTWNHNNKGKINAASAVRRARLNSVPIEEIGSITEFYITAKSRPNNTCYHCGQLFTEPPDIDHIVPLSRGGSHSIDNLCVSCEFCNCSKKDKLIGEWKSPKMRIMT